MPLILGPPAPRLIGAGPTVSDRFEESAIRQEEAHAVPATIVEGDSSHRAVKGDDATGRQVAPEWVRRGAAFTVVQPESSKVHRAHALIAELNVLIVRVDPSIRVPIGGGARQKLVQVDVLGRGRWDGARQGRRAGRSGGTGRSRGTG